MERNRHHIWFDREWYRSKADKAFREHRGFLIPTLITTHNELHAQVQQPPKPHASLQRDILDHLGSFNYDYRSTLLQTVSFIGERALEADSEHQALRLQAMASNILAQCNLLLPYQEEVA